MNQTWKLLIPLGLGLAASWLNYTSRISEVQPIPYVKLNKDLKRGDKIKQDDLEVLNLPQNLGSLDQTAIRWGDRAVVFERPAPRAMKTGDLLLWRDATGSVQADYSQDKSVKLFLNLEGLSLADDLKVGQKIGFFLPDESPEPPSPLTVEPAKDGKNAEPKSTQPAAPKRNFRFVGPYRVLNVGPRLLPDPTDDAPVGSRGTFLTLAIDMPKNNTVEGFDENTIRLMTAVFNRSGGARGGSLVVYPPDPIVEVPVKKGKTE